MRLLDRYLLRELLVPLAYCLGFLLVIYVAFDLMFQINHFLEAHLQFLDIVEYYVVTLPELLYDLVLPVSLLLALLYATTNHSRFNEFTAIRAVGIGLWRLAVPYFAVGAVFGAVVFLIGECWLSSADDRARLIMERRTTEPGRRNEPATLLFHNQATHRDWSLDRFTNRTCGIQHLVLTSEMRDGGIQTLDALRAAYTNGHWLLYNTTEYHTKKGESIAMFVSSNAVVPLDVPETPEWIRSEIKFNGLRAADAAKGPQFSLHEIRAYLRLHQAVDADKKAKLLTQLEERIAAPFTCLAVVLIALPFGARAGRHNVFVGVASSIFICFGYFILQKISIGLGLGGYLSPVVAAWLPNLVCAGTGLVMLARVR